MNELVHDGSRKVVTAPLHLILRVNPFKCINNLADGGLNVRIYTDVAYFILLQGNEALLKSIYFNSYNVKNFVTVLRFRSDVLRKCLRKENQEISS